MIFDGSMHQLPDIDPTETNEWMESLDAVIDTHGKTRARYLLSRLLERAQQNQVSFPATVSTPYVNSIPREQEPWFPGDEHLERRIRAYIRWNAAVMVIRANTRAEGIGGHLSTFASSASLYEIGFNHFFRGKDDGQAGDHIYFQGHAAPGVYARAFLEGRLSTDDLDHYRREIGREDPLRDAQEISAQAETSRACPADCKKDWGRDRRLFRSGRSREGCRRNLHRCLGEHGRGSDAAECIYFVLPNQQ
jgi:pyruvate dehydrogenase E1 component